MPNEPLRVYDKDDLRRRAPLASVAAALGIFVDDGGYARCPFHDDSKPSFNLFVDPAGVQRWGCFPCGISGDAFDLVQRVKYCSWGEAMRFVAKILDEAPEYKVQIPEKVKLDWEGLRTYVHESAVRARLHDNASWIPVITGLTPEQDLEVGDKLLRLGWGIDERGNVVMPHYDRNGFLVGCKVRSMDGSKWSFPGSKFEHLYGAWLARTGPAVFLTEGETDFAALHVRGANDPASVDARSLPTGAGSHRDEWTGYLTGWYRVYLSLDGDEAGRKAADSWTERLAGSGTEVWYVNLKDEEDVKSSGLSVRELIARSHRVI